jgi:siderophore synthetase component
MFYQVIAVDANVREIITSLDSRLKRSEKLSWRVLQAALRSRKS